MGRKQILWLHSGLALAVLTIWATLAAGPAQAKGGQIGLGLACRPAELARFEADFRRIAQQRAQTPYLISEADYRVAALNYILQAESCFQAMNEAGREAATSQPLLIDEGGLSPYTGQMEERYATGGLKWGAGSPFSPYGQNMPGPGLPGGIVTYSYMPTGVVINSTSDPHSGRMVTDVRSLPGVSGCAEAEIDAAFAAWSAVANIQFQKVADSQTDGGAANSFGDIRIGAHSMDHTSSSGTVLAHAFFPPFTLFPASISGDLHFDVDEPWSCTPGPKQVDIGVVALHEIGHSIGLGHETQEVAVMNPFYNSTLTGLLADDTQGAVAIYGGAVIPKLQVSIGAAPVILSLDAKTIEYTLFLENQGNIDLSGAVLTAVIPEETSLVAVTALGGETSPGSRTIVWPPATIPVGSILERHLTVQITALLKKGDQLVNTVSVEANELQLEGIQFVHIVNPEIVYLPSLRN